MKYKATLGTTSILITVFISLLIACLIILFTYRIIMTTHATESIVAVLIILFLITLYILSYLYRPKWYLLDDENLVICRPIKDVIISINEIKDVFIVKKESMMWTERVGGNGGLFGFYGNFKNNFGLTTWYATKLKNYVMIETMGKDKIVITPDNTSIVNEIRLSIRKRSSC